MVDRMQISHPQPQNPPLSLPPLTDTGPGDHQPQVLEFRRSRQSLIMFSLCNWLSGSHAFLSRITTTSWFPHIPFSFYVQGNHFHHHPHSLPLGSLSLEWKSSIPPCPKSVMASLPDYWWGRESRNVHTLAYMSLAVKCLTRECQKVL